MDPNRVIIFDTTLRDGEQSPGISLNADREAGDRPAARAARRRRDRGWIPDRLARVTSRRYGRSPGRCTARSSPAWRAPTRRTSSAPPRRCATPSARACTRSSPRSDIHIQHQLQSTREDVLGQAARRRRARALAGRGRRVQPDGRHPRRRRVHRRGAAGRDRRGRDHDQHPGHRRLRDAERVRGVPGPPVRAGAGAARRRAVASTATTTSAWPWPTRSPACRPARARSSARSTASASARATRRWRRS